MTRRPFGSTGLNVSPLGFGGASLFDGDEEKARALLNRLLDEGMNLIDTAACYGKSESLIGRVLESRRDEFILITKCGHHEILPDGRMRSRRITISDVDLALKNLRTEVIDVMLLHSYDLDLLEQGDALAVLAKARDSGKIRFVGYSGDNETASAAARIPEISVLEMSLSLCDQANAAHVLPLARERNLAVIAKRPVANAAWVHRNSAPEEYAALHAAEYVRRLQEMKLDPALLGLSSDSESAWAELFLRFTLSMENVHCAIVGTMNAAKMEANYAAAEKGPLPKNARQYIREAFQRAEGDSCTKWRGQN